MMSPYGIMKIIDNYNISLRKGKVHLNCIIQDNKEPEFLSFTPWSSFYENSPINNLKAKQLESDLKQA